MRLRFPSALTMLSLAVIAGLIAYPSYARHDEQKRQQQFLADKIAQAKREALYAASDGIRTFKFEGFMPTMYERSLVVEAATAKVASRFYLSNQHPDLSLVVDNARAKRVVLRYEESLQDPELPTERTAYIRFEFIK